MCPRPSSSEVADRIPTVLGLPIRSSMPERRVSRRGNAARDRDKRPPRRRNRVPPGILKFLQAAAPGSRVYGFQDGPKARLH